MRVMSTHLDLFVGLVGVRTNGQIVTFSDLEIAGGRSLFGSSQTESEWFEAALLGPPEEVAPHLQSQGR